MLNSHHSAAIGWDGVWTLLLATLLFFLSFGLILLPALWHVFRVAYSASIQGASSDPALVFGKKLLNGKADEDYQKRLLRAYALIQANPERLVILLGGKGEGDQQSEAQVGYDFLKKKGLPASAHILLEQESRHTLENLKHAREYLAGRSASNVLLISNRYHLARCSLIAGNLRIPHTLCAAEERLEFSHNNLLKLFAEAYGVLWFKVGRLWATITRNQKMLDRIT